MPRKFFIALIALTSLTACSRGNPDSSDVEVHCEEMVRKQLKAPSTASFGNDVDATETPTGWQWSSYVDAENSFGAKMRSQFTCVVTGKTWEDATIKVNFQ